MFEGTKSKTQKLNIVSNHDFIQFYIYILAQNAQVRVPPPTPSPFSNYLNLPIAYINYQYI